ncbi:MAG: hypothetical protein NC394_10185 [Bacteroides sp.]|nr:hypothetical protein [Bacteroides sp.]
MTNGEQTLFHASGTGGIKTLTPRISNHGIPLVYFSQKRENVLVYLSNAVEKCCREAGYDHSGPYTVWGSYGFNGEGILTLEEYWHNAAFDTYKGVKGYIYTVKNGGFEPMSDIPFAYTSASPVETESCEAVSDAYEALLEAAEQGKIIITRYEDNTQKKLDWIERTVREEFEASADRPEYRFFLREKFEFLK